MINLLQLNNLVRFLFFFIFIIFNLNLYAAEDIWKKKEAENKQIQEGDEEEITINNPTLSEDVNKIKSLLVDQITSRVKWRESVNYMIQNGITNFLEIGPGKVLSNLIKKINKDVKVTNLVSLKDLKND